MAYVDMYLREWVPCRIDCINHTRIREDDSPRTNGHYGAIFVVQFLDNLTGPPLEGVDELRDV